MISVETVIRIYHVNRFAGLYGLKALKRATDYEKKEINSNGINYDIGIGFYLLVQGIHGCR
jgi:hypothetical protein